MALTSGTRLGPYEIVSPIGAGSMGEVYKANDTRLDRTVAIKVLPEHLSKNEELRQRLDQEFAIGGTSGYCGPGRAMKRWVKSESMVRASWISYFSMMTKLRQSTAL